MANMALPNVWHENTELGIEVYSDSQYWYVKVKETGDIRFSYPKTVDVFLVGGGGAGASGNGASGGGGGYARTWRGIGLERNVNYHVEIGRGGIPSFSSDAGGGQGGDGGATRFTVGDTTYEVEGGKGGIRLGNDKNSPGGDGGSGGGAGTYIDGQYGGDGGSNAGNGGRTGKEGNVASGGIGQASREGDHGYPATTRAFGTGELYAGGGGGSSRDMPRGGNGGAGGGGKGGSRMNSVDYPPEDGAPNTGGGGGGATWDRDSGIKGGGAGGSGVVIIRGDQLDLLPVWFDGVQLSDIFLNDVPVENMWFGDLKLF